MLYYIAQVENALQRMKLRFKTSKRGSPHIGNTNFGFIKEMF